MNEEPEQPATAITFDVSPSKRTHGLIIAGLLAITGVLSLLAAGPDLPDGKMVGLVALALAAVLAFHVRRTTGVTGPGMVLDSGGIWFREWYMTTVPWRFVTGSRMAGNRLRPLIYIEIDDSADLFAHMEADGGARPALGPLVRRTRLTIPNSALDAPLNQVAVAIRRAHENARMMTKSSSP